MDIDRLCQLMHSASIRAAVEAGEEPPRPWAEVSEANRVIMRAAVQALLDEAELWAPSKTSFGKARKEGAARQRLVAWHMFWVWAGVTLAILVIAMLVALW